MWEPQASFMNVQRCSKPLAETYYIFPNNGIVRIAAKYVATFIDSFAWYRYPFDKQRLTMAVQVWGSDNSNVRLRHQRIGLTFDNTESLTPLFSLVPGDEYRNITLVTNTSLKSGRNVKHEFELADVLIWQLHIRRGVFTYILQYIIPINI